MQGFLYTRLAQPVSSRSRPQLTAARNITTADWEKGKTNKAANSAGSHTHKLAVFGPEHCCWRLHHVLNVASFVSFKDYDEQPYIIKLSYFRRNYSFREASNLWYWPVILYHVTAGTTRTGLLPPNKKLMRWESRPVHFLRAEVR